MVGLAGVCREKVEDEEVKSDLSSIQEAGRRVAEQISDILDYSEIDSKRLTTNTEDYMISSVLHDLHANMHTFSWVGSPIPLFEQCREFLTGLLNHKRQSVRDWAKSCIEEYDKEILREKSQDEFERMHYDKGE